MQRGGSQRGGPNLFGKHMLTCLLRRVIDTAAALSSAGEMMANAMRCSRKLPEAAVNFTAVRCCGLILDSACVLV